MSRFFNRDGLWAVAILASLLYSFVYNAFMFQTTANEVIDSTFNMLGGDGPSKYLSSLIGENTTDSLTQLLATALTSSTVWDEQVDPERERERCRNYGYGYSNQTNRRRVFWGSLIADDSWHVLAIAAMEAYGIFDTVALVESNTTQSLYPRKIRFGPDSKNLRALQGGMWGPDTRVSVDYFHDPDKEHDGLWRENLQREMILELWRKNGMKHDDIGYLGDVDEVVTRDFLRALQICDVPQFRPGQDCKRPKLLASTLVFEGSPMCILKDSRWYHPDLVIGECVDKIGDEKKHPPVLRNNTSWGVRLRLNSWETLNRTMFPLWNAADFRMTSGGDMIQGKDNLHTAYHFHNFFASIVAMRNKYLTYGHPVDDALTMPLGMISGDIGFMVDCLMNGTEDGNNFKRVPGGWKSLHDATPIAFQKVTSYSNMRHKELQQMLAQDEVLNPPNHTLEHPTNEE